MANCAKEIGIWPRPAGPSPTTLTERRTRGHPYLAAPAVPNRAQEKPPVMGYRGTLEKGQAFTVPTTILSAQPAGSLESKAGPRVERCKEETHLPLCQDCLQLLQEDAETFWAPLRARR